jgi:ATP-binding cassette subfamily A (ABC1) protein 1
VYANYECTGIGLNASTAKVVYNNYSFATALGMMGVSAIVFTVLGLYLDKVIPSKWGKSQHPCFCVAPKFWGCGGKARRERMNSAEVAESFISNPT